MTNTDSTPDPARLRILGISGSLRAHSANAGLLRASSEILADRADFAVADLTDVPFYNDDANEPPASVQAVLDQIAEADALLFAVPEYNFSMAPALKNIIDWASKEPGNALLAGKPVAMMGAGGRMGTSRAQYHLRQVCVYTDMHPINKPEVFSNAAKDFDAEGNLTDPKVGELLERLLVSLEAWTRQLMK